MAGRDRSDGVQPEGAPCRCRRRNPTCRSADASAHRATTVGGGVEAGDADFEAVLRREVMEEIGATTGPVTEFLTLTEPDEKGTVVQHCFRADVLDMALDRRSGPELDDPDIGDFSPVRVASDASVVSALELHPSELADRLREYAGNWGA
ncbi:NUDIX domain-containing protein [Streptomyces caeni]|uniref:NUDIX domain-containing protein n=1 Tax=Streptomyces caeni TaxID=2307231 RepID=A0ABW4ITZ7_9ACTN